MMASILIIEDDPWLADCYRVWLAAAGYAVRTVGDAQAALDALDAVRPDVILLDMFLPHANGVQVLHTLQSYEDWADIPVLLCSSSFPDNMPDLTAYGVRRVVAKSDLSPSRLQDELKEVLLYAAL
ncbi:MAG TPA: response regulator [Candidatus Saccharimonadales bacterium]|nr:response regulator [Candidatus Saccharimonadales bacterium]